MNKDMSSIYIERYKNYYKNFIYDPPENKYRKLPIVTNYCVKFNTKRYIENPDKIERMNKRILEIKKKLYELYSPTSNKINHEKEFLKEIELLKLYTQKPDKYTNNTQYKKSIDIKTNKTLLEIIIKFSLDRRIERSDYIIMDD